MTPTKLSKVRRLAALLVLGNLAAIGALAVVLPEAALGALPIVALMLPLLTAAVLESTLSKRPPHDRGDKQPTRNWRLNLHRPLPRAA
jgi:fatty acid desaturase